MTVTNLDPRSKEFLATIDKDFGIYQTKSSTNRDIIVNSNKISSRFSGTYFRSIVESVNLSSTLRFLHDIPAITLDSCGAVMTAAEDPLKANESFIVDMEFSYHDSYKSLSEEESKTIFDRVSKYFTEMFEQNISFRPNFERFSTRSITGAESIVIGSRNKNTNADPLVIPVNKFIYIPGKIECYTFRIELPSNVTNVLSYVKNKGIYVSIWLSEYAIRNKNCSSFPKYVNRGITYELAKYIYSLRGINVYPDSSMSTKIKVGEDIISVDIPVQYASTLISDMYSCKSFYGLDTSLYDRISRSSGFSMSAFQFKRENCGNLTADKNNILAKSSNKILRDFVQYFISASGKTYNNYYYNCDYNNADYSSRVITKDFSDYLIDQVNSYYKELITNEVFTEHPDIIKNESGLVEETVFRNASTRSKAGQSILNTLTV